MSGTQHKVTTSMLMRFVMMMSSVTTSPLFHKDVRGQTVFFGGKLKVELCQVCGKKYLHHVCQTEWEHKHGLHNQELCKLCFPCANSQLDRKIGKSKSPIMNLSRGINR